MYKQILPVAAMATILLGAASCKSNGGFKKTKDGAEYNIVKDASGTQTPKEGDFLTFNIKVLVGDSVIYDNKINNQGKPIEMPLPKMEPMANTQLGSIEVLQMLTAGDSVVIRRDLDSMIRKQMTFAKPTDKMEFRYSLISIKTKEQFESDMKAKTAGQAQADDKTIAEYLAKNNITAQKTSSGLYYVITKQGAGANPTTGQNVKMKYTGKLLDGSIFDSNIESGFNTTEPLEFPLGQRRVIPGWDEGVALLNKGAKATFFIPSTLAYGEQSPSPKLPANSILIFDVELLDFK
jgi:FKBP-type peptidyl-prolyl cis-trans isomerase